MTTIPAIPAMRGVSYYVPNMAYAVDVGLDSIVRVDLGAPVAASAAGIFSALSIAANGTSSAFAVTYGVNSMGRYGRNVTVVASGAAATAFTVNGTDYLGQFMSETLTLNGTTPVVGAKMFRYITSVSYLATAVTVNVGWGDRLGIPYRAVNTTLLNELVSKAVPTAGTLVAGVAVATPQTATTADPRGYYTPQASFLADGTRTYAFSYYADIVDGLHGNRHFTL